MNFEQRLEEIRHRFRTRTSREASSLENEWLQAKDGCPECMIAIRERAHALAGTAATLQFEALASTARKLEAAIERADSPGEIGGCITELVQSLRAIALHG